MQLLNSQSNFGCISYRFRNMTFKDIKNDWFSLPLPCLTRPLGGTC